MDEFRRYLAGHHGVFTRGPRSAVRIHRQSDPVAPPGRRVDAGGTSGVPLATAADSWPARARAEALSARGLISHTSGLGVWAVDGHLHRADVHVVVAEGQHRERGRASVHRLTGPRSNEGHLIDGVPVVGIEQAVIDSASLLIERDLDATVDAVVRQELTTVEALRAGVERLGTRGRKGLGVLRRLLIERDATNPIPDSGFNRFVGRLTVGAGLPEPDYGFEVRHRGRLVGRVDLAYPGAGLAIECDSARWHRTRAWFERDPRRRNRLMLAGYRVLSFHLG